MKRLLPLLLLLLLGHHPGVDATPQGVIPAPVLKWQRGGCFSSWCQTGWYSSPAVADIDNDGQMEVIWGSYDLVALNGSTGALKWRAPSGGRVWPDIALADLTGDGDLEIIVGRGSDSLTVYNHLGAVEWQRNPFGSGEIRTLAVTDLDGNGQMEIIVGRASGGATKQVNVYNANGTVRSGWPARRDGEPGYGWGMYNQNIAIADMNGNGVKEIFAPTDTHYITALDDHGNQLTVNPIFTGRQYWSQVGVHVDHVADVRGYANCGTEHRPNFANAAPAIADVNNDGILELIVVGDVYNCAIGDPAGDLYYLPWIFKLDRTRWSGNGYNWTVIPNPSPNSGPLSQNYSVIENSVTNAVVVDLDNDGLKEILYSSYDGQVHAYWLDKTEHGNWPYKVPGSGIRFASEPVVLDWDNDGYAEVIFTSWPEKRDNLVGQLHVLDYLGNPLHVINLPPPFSGNWNGGLGAPTIANIDGDADLELVIGTSHSGVVAFDLPGSAGARVLWGTGRGSYERTGVAAAGLPPLALNIIPPAQAIQPAQAAQFTLDLFGTINDPIALQVTANPIFTVQLSGNNVPLPATVTLTLTDTRPPGPLMPGLWYTITIQASGGGEQVVETARLLVGGSRVFTPLVRK
ncbi:MAG: VCBS repeat-containing protein [Anaerolineae bacterium]|nr:VCBS repeat-containing protein [Anaerolineae bacterium]